MLYRIFTNDVDQGRGYSCMMRFEAASDDKAIERATKAVKRWAPVKMLAIPDGRVDESFRKGSGTSLGGLKPLKGVFESYGKFIR